MTVRAILLSLLLIEACSKARQPSTERLAVLPFENLSAEGETDRVGPALLVSALAQVPDVDPMPVESVQQAYSLHANRFLHTYVVARNEKLQLQAEIEDAVAHKITRSFQLDGAASLGVGPLVAKLATEINAAAKLPSIPNGQAYELLNRALQAANPTGQDEAFQAAIQKDPHFGAAYEMWAKVLLARNDRERAADIASQGESAGVDELSKAHLAYLKARAQQDSAAQIAALQKLTAMCPGGSEQYERLAELQFAARQFGASAAAYGTALRLDPDNGALENMRGYTEAFNGNLDQARQALKRYAEAVPEQRANAQDSLGEVDFYSGDFAGAEAAFVSSREWLKAAQARLMTGDLAGANKLLERYPQGLPTFERAQWEFLTGSRKSGLARLEAEAGKAQGERAALLWAQTAVWQLQTGDRAEAGNSARKAGRVLGGLMEFLVQGSAQRSGSPIADALSAIFRRDFQAALPLLEQAYTKTLPNADGQIRVLLAWVNLETGHFDRARELLRFPPIPLSAGDQMFASLVFPRFFAIRSAVLKQQGKLPEAERDLQLFQRYSGDLPDKFQ